MKYATSLAFRCACFFALALFAIPALLAGMHHEATGLYTLGMAAATASFDVPERSGETVSHPVATGVVIYAGALVALNSTGYAVPAADTAGLRVIGRAEQEVDNTSGADGDLDINVKQGVFRYANSGTNAIDADDVGKFAFVEFDNSVAETSTYKVKAGRVVAVETGYVWIDTRFASIVPTALTALAALTSTNGTMAAAADDAATKAEGEKIGDDVRAVHATVTTIITALQNAGIAI